MREKSDESAFDEYEDPFYNINSTMSTNDCTGLVPSGVLDDSESESYGELYSIHAPLAPHDGNKGHKEMKDTPSFPK